MNDQLKYKNYVTCYFENPYIIVTKIYYKHYK